MDTELYIVGLFEDNDFIGYAHTGRPETIRVYTSVKTAKKGINAIKNKRYYPNPKSYEYRIFKVNSLEDVTE